MADCSNNFNKSESSYLTNISLKRSKIDQLIISRNALREKLRSFLKEKKVNNPRFYRQGSYAHKTLIIPLNGDYDIDDGTYIDLKGFEKEPSTRTIHNWIMQAVEDHTKTPPKDKEPCVRSVFKEGYHVDLPIYKIEITEGLDAKFFLAKKSAGWEESNPRAMTGWFQDKVKKNSEQIRRLVKYFKGWRDYRSTKLSTKLPSGFTLTILTCEQYQSDIRDDISFLETARAILKRLKINDEIMKPYEPKENMRDYLTDAQFDNFLTALENVLSTGDEALNEESHKEGAMKWQKIFGDRFPILEDPGTGESSEAKKFEGPAIIGTTVKSA
jgi:hypothetical protein